MRRLISLPAKYIAVVAVGALLTLCSLGSFLQHGQGTQAPAAKSNCSSACHQHSQTANLGSQEDKKEEDDKEPIPPVFAWLAGFDNLALLYVAPIIYLVFTRLQFQKLLQASQLRL